MKDNEFKIMVMSAVNKLLDQGEQSTDFGTSGCMYRSSEGLCCIVGFMMDDETAHKADSMGESSVYYLIRDGLWGEDLTELQVSQLVRLQGCHDFVDNFEPFNEEFIKAVKSTYNLAWLAKALKEQGE